jgi:hypothetical protein
MKWLLAFLTGLFFSQAAAGQGALINGNVVVSNPTRPPMYLRELFSQPFQSQKHAGISGSLFIFDKWLLASVKMEDDRVDDSVYIRINAYENKLHFKDENGEEMQSAVAIKQITITDNNPAWHGAIFRSGYKGGGNAFFQVLEDGKNMQLLKKWTVNKWETKVMGEEDKRSFELESEVFFGGYGNVYKQNKKCNMLSEAFEKKQEEILRFAATNDIKCNKEEDMRKLVRYFNSL